jgi:hypothetical protein
MDFQRCNNKYKKCHQIIAVCLSGITKIQTLASTTFLDFVLLGYKNPLIVLARVKQVIEYKKFNKFVF